jgi:large subunit ribosomal protein L14
MIQLNSNLSVIDNSGAREAKCIKILGGSFSGSLGDNIVVALQKVAPNRKVKSGDVAQSLVVRVCKETKRKDGTTLKFFKNSAILLNQKKLPVGTRIFGPVPRELRTKKFMKVISIAQGII